MKSIFSFFNGDSGCFTWAVAWLLVLVIIYKILDHLLRLPRVRGDYADRYILVTGSSRGFGFECVKRLDSMGCHVFAGVRSRESAEALRAACSDRVDPVMLDISDRASVEKAFQYVNLALNDKKKELWGLVNNAGLFVVAPIDWLSVNDYTGIMNVNTFGPVHVTLTFLPLILQSRGRIVNMSSITGRITASGYVSSYTMTKYALEAFNDSVRLSVRDAGVKVSVLEPGFYKTDMAANIMRDIRKIWDGLSSDRRAELGVNSLKAAMNYGKKLTAVASENIDEVTNAYEHALFGRFPKARYLLGNHARFIYLPLSVVPEWLSDFVLSFVAKH